MEEIARPKRTADARVDQTLLTHELTLLQHLVEEQPRPKRTADARVAAPGTGKRGREKRTPRQFK